MVAAVNAAFCDHRPLVLSPDMFWLLICQGLARHVNANSESLRRSFVEHDGKAKIIVRRDDFVKGSPENSWSEVFAEFSAQIKNHIGEENHANIVASFSTTGSIERAANEVVLMDTLKSYFKYEFHSLCGIPEVALEGTAEDWSELAKRAERLGSAYDLGWWTIRITPILERIARNAAGAHDPQLWQDIYKIDSMSGGPYINGWLVVFFPYLQTTGFFHLDSNERVEDVNEIYEKRDQLRKQTIDTRNWRLVQDTNRGITTPNFPGGLCRTPFIWRYLVHTYEMEFIAGFIAFTQDSKSLAVRPKIGWAVRAV